MEKNPDQVQKSSIKKTGVVWHEDMTKHAPPGWPENNHCENPQRLKSLMQRFRDCESFQEKDVELISEYPEADKSFVNEGHNKDTYYDYIQNVYDPEQRFADSYNNIHTTRASLLAANAVKVALDEIYKKKTWKNAFLCIRPPGHHADGTGEGGYGFCYINNVVCGARYAQKKYGVKKICIFDWDIHHGDSSQILTYDDVEILYISFHRYDNGSMFPGKTGSHQNLGGEKALGFNLNLPWNIEWKNTHKMLGSEEYILAFERLVAPILEEWKPDLTFVSAGFDSCKGDQQGGIAVKPSCYAYLTNRLSALTYKKRVIVALEGGYNYDSISQASECVFRALREEKDPVKSVEIEGEVTYDQLLLMAVPTLCYLERIEEVGKEWEKYWPCIKDENLSENLRKTLDRVWEIAALRQKIVGPNLRKFGHQEIDLENSEFFTKHTDQPELDFYSQLQKSDELKDFKNLFPEILEITEKSVKMKNIMQLDGLYEYASLLKIDLKSDESDVLEEEKEADFDFKFVETNIKDNLKGNAIKFCPMDDYEIWKIKRPESRVYEGIIRFFNANNQIDDTDVPDYIKKVSEQLKDILNVIDTTISQMPEFSEKNLHLSELSLVIMIQHEVEESCVKQISPKFKEGKGIDHIINSIKQFKKYVDDLPIQIKIKGTDFAEKENCCIF